MKQLLLIAYHFPPDSAVGAVRPAKFAQYLPNFGWRPIVLTVPEESYDLRDYEKFASSLDSVAVYRRRPAPSPLQAWARLHGEGKPAGKTGNSGNGVSTPNGHTRSSSFKRFASALLRLPDERQGWVPTVVREGYRIMRREGITAFMTSGPPMSSHLGGLLLKRLTHAYWIADFRDPWVISHRFRDPAFRSAPCEYLEERLELSVLKAADLVVSTAPGLTRYFRSRLSQDDRTKCVTVTNGYDEADFVGLETVNRSPNGVTLLRHAGSLYLGRSPEPFFEALGNLIQRRAIAEGSVRVEFIGSGYYNNTPVAALAEKHGVGSMVSIVPAMPFRACLQSLVSADALLLFAQGFPEQVPAKVFECLRLDRPVFAVLDKGDAMDLMGDIERCFVAESTRVDLIEEQFMQMRSAIARKEVRTGMLTRIERYERQNLTSYLVSYLEGNAAAVPKRREGGRR